MRHVPLRHGPDTAPLRVFLAVLGYLGGMVDFCFLAKPDSVDGSDSVNFAVKASFGGVVDQVSVAIMLALMLSFLQ